MKEKKVSVSVLLISALAVEWGKEGEKTDREWGENKNKNGAADDRSRLTLTTSSETPDAIDLASLMVASSPMTLSSMISQ